MDIVKKFDHPNIVKYYTIHKSNTQGLEVFKIYLTFFRTPLSITF
jgi:hypothetical protein